MSQCPNVFAVLFVVVLAPTIKADDDPITVKLEQAKTAYEADQEKFKKSVGDWFDRTEQAARGRGDKKAVDRIVVERKAFDERGIVPANVPPAVTQQSVTARSKMEAAYTLAIKEYTKSKQDAAAASSEQQLETFRRTATGISVVEWVRARIPGRWKRKHDGQIFEFHPDGKVVEVNAQNAMITTGKWSIGKDGAGAVSLANNWKFSFTLTEPASMTAPAINPRGGQEGPWELKRIEK
jgi:hypothetical protein